MTLCLRSGQSCAGRSHVSPVRAGSWQRAVCDLLALFLSIKTLQGSWWQSHHMEGAVVTELWPIGAKLLANQRYLFYLFTWLHHVECWILVPWPGIEPLPPVLEAQNLNHWTTKEVLRTSVLDYTQLRNKHLMCKSLTWCNYHDS